MRAVNLVPPARGSGLLGRSLAASAAAVLLAGCGGSAGGQPGATATTTVTSSPTASPAASAAARPPGIVAVTAGGALVVLDPATGATTTTLVPRGVIGDEISVSASGIVYFAVSSGCDDEIESVPVTAGQPVVITAGRLPALSPDGTKLAFASEPSISDLACFPNNTDPTSLYKLVVRTLATGAQVTYPMVSAAQSSGLPAPIS
ncbi:MAG: hypothetical protein ACRDNZ_16470, partial [Streptosporangiaceae bacterium]